MGYGEFFDEKGVADILEAEGYGRMQAELAVSDRYDEYDSAWTTEEIANAIMADLEDLDELRSEEDLEAEGSRKAELSQGASKMAGMEGWAAEDIRDAVIDQLQQKGKSAYDAEDLWSGYADYAYDDAEDGLSAEEIADAAIDSILASRTGADLSIGGGDDWMDLDVVTLDHEAVGPNVANVSTCKYPGCDYMIVLDMDSDWRNDNGKWLHVGPPAKAARRKQADFGSAQVALEITAEMPTAAAEWLADQFEQMIYDGTIISDDAWEVFGVSSVSVVA